MKRKIGFAVAGLLAACGAFLVFLYLRDSRSTQEATASDPVAAEDFTNDSAPDATDGIAIDPENPDGVPAELAFVDADPVEYPEDYLSVTFSLGSERALGGKVRPGDTVAVVASFTPELSEFGGELARSTDIILHKALVADVQVEDTFTTSAVTAPASAPVPEGSLSGTVTSTYFITLALPAAEVERLVYALEYSQIWLAYQPESAGVNSNGVMTQENIHEGASIFIDRDQIAGLGDGTPEDLALTDDAGDGNPEG